MAAPLQNVSLPTIKLTTSGTVSTPPQTPSPNVVTPPPQTADPDTVSAVNVTTATFANQAQAPQGPEAPTPTPNQVQAIPTPEQLANIDPSTVDYYNVMVSDTFQYAGITFRPGRIWQVKPQLYHGSLDDGTAFADHCSQVLPQAKAV
jgi:hypothetical protein